MEPLRFKATLDPPTPTSYTLDMVTSLLSTKLHTPKPRETAIRRPHLIKRLSTGLTCKLTLISAAAGFGKTSLISEWVAQETDQTAWLSLDESDSDLIRFLSYLIVALRGVVPTFGETQLDLLQSSQQVPPIEPLLTSLINELAALSERIIFVLDDYHSVQSSEIDLVLTFLIEHLPPSLHLVLATREDPPLPLARLRVKGQLNELRASDLRFTVEETASFLNGMMGLELSTDDINILETRTEGWIAGLQLAALSIQHNADASAFIKSFSGSHRFVLDYLIEEVLNQQRKDIQGFLLQTAVLDRLCGSLCDAMLNNPSGSGQKTLEYLERANLFLIPLDNERRWYRYHHLFAELLYQRLLQTYDSNQIDTLHQRASEWYEAEDQPVQAFLHAAKAHDLGRAERLMQGDGVPLYFQGVITPILNWLSSLSERTFHAHPSLKVWYAFVLTMAGQNSLVETHLQEAEKNLATNTTEDAQNLIGHIAAIRAMLAGPHYHIDIMIEESRRALELISPDSVAVRTAMSWLLGLANQWAGHREAAKDAFADVIHMSRSTDNRIIELAALTCIGQLHEADNNLYRAFETFQQIIDMFGEPSPPYTCEAYLGLARIAYQWNDLEIAQDYAQQAEQLGRRLETVDTPIECQVLMAHIQHAHRDTAAALSTLRNAEQVAKAQQYQQVRSKIAESQVFLMLQAGHIEASKAKLQNHDTMLSHIRFALATGDAAAALRLLEPLYQEAEAKNWHDERLKLLVLRARIFDELGAKDEAFNNLQEALSLAEASAFIRIFVDEGTSMLSLLNQTLALGIKGEYIRQILVAFPPNSTTAVPRPNVHTTSALIEPLSNREIEVLELISKGMTNQEIASTLHLSLHTVKVHARNIYSKLDVNNRTQAVARAKALGIPLDS